MSTVSELYQARVAEGRLQPDAAQLASLPLLDALVAGVQDAAPAAPRSGWRGLFGRPAPAVAARPQSNGVYMWGGVGRGKSMLMDLVMDAAPIKAKRRVHFHGFMQEVQAGLNEARKAGTQDAVRPVAERIARECRLFCFDEMQITDIADAMIVGRLFQILFDQGVVIVVTSNRVPEELYKNGLNRQLFLPFIALLKERMQVYHLESPVDHRQGREGGRPIWFQPADREARLEIDDWWADLTRDAAPEPLVLDIKGHKLEVAEHASRVGRSDFWNLCGKAFGPADYLALAEALDVLMIDGIPRLGPSNYNEAKRFVTLVDALYEAKTRLIASAVDLPDRLYTEGEGAFEFERTASRLHEMQEDGWGRRPIR